MRSTLDHQAELMKRQLALEEEMREEGQNKYLKNIEKRISSGDVLNTGTGNKLASKAFVKLSTAFTNPPVKEFKADKKHRTILLNSGVGLPQTCLTIIRTIFENTFRDSCGYTALCIKIGNALEDEILATQFKKAHPKYYREMIADIGQAKSYAVKRKIAQHKMHKFVDSITRWTKSQTIGIGHYCLNIFQQKTGYLEIRTENIPHSRKVKTRKIVRPSKKLTRYIEEDINFLASIQCAYLPMLVPPADWEDMTSGGYLNPIIKPLTFIKHFSKNYLQDANNIDMPVVYNAVNSLQKTPWRVNAEVYDVLKNLWESGFIHDDLDLPERQNLDEPPYPFPEKLDWENATLEDKKILRKYNQTKASYSKRNSQNRSKRLQTMRMLDIATRFVDEHAFYFPYNCDFRGRIYAIPMYLNPQSNDLAKGLLEFGEGKPIEDNHAVDWLMIHGANSYGIDKVSFKERIEWVEEHSEVILECARDPYTQRFWMDADKPWQFLAFCYEWLKFYEEGLGFKSYLPIGVDGSCNGLQHFSALVKDAKGGFSVNLIDSNKPQDIYQNVADQVIKQLSEETNPTMKPVAQAWLEHGINRKLCKKPVMVYPYGGTIFSNTDFYLDEMEGTTNDPIGFLFGMESNKVCRYLAEQVDKAIEEVIISAPKVMAYIQSLAKESGKSNRPLVWETPSGFVVMQDYKQRNRKQFNLSFNGKTTKMYANVDNPALQNTRKVVNASSPNFIHSMDAACLHLTVDRLVNDFGLMDFMMIHDSYGVHASDVHILNQVLREVFVEVYTLNQLERFSNALNVQDTVPSLVFGDLDIKAVKESTYFFA